VPVADDIIGSVAVEVLPSAKSFVQRFKQQVLPGARQAGDELGSVAGTAAAKALADRLKNGIEEGFRRSDAARQGGKQGEEFGGAFARTVKARLDAALRNLPKAKVDADTTGAQRQLAELRARMAELSGKKIGVDITAKEALARLAALRAELDRLASKSTDIRVNVDARTASAELAKLRGELEGVFRAGGPSAGSLGEAGAGGGPVGLGAAIAAGLTLVGPAAGAATAGIAAVGAAAGTTMLAIQGIRTEMKNQTVDGRAFTAEVKSSQSALSLLEATAARYAQPGIFSALSQVNAFLPTLNPLVGDLAKHLSTAFSIGTGGLIQGLKTAEPLLSDAGVDATVLAQKFADFAGSSEFRHFIDYARRELPIIGHDMQDFATAAIHTAVALQPLGDALLRILDDASHVVDTLAKITKWSMPKDQVAPSAGTSGIGPGYHSGGAKPNLLHQINDTIVNGAVDFLTGDQSDPGGVKKRAAQQKAAADQAAAAAKQQVTALNDAARAAAFNQLAMQNTGLAQLVTKGDYDTATAAIKKQEEQLAATTAQMRIQGDVSGLLQQAEDKLSGKAYSAANAQNTFEQGIVSLLQNVKSGGPVFTGLSQAAITNRSSLLQLRDAALAAAGTYGDVNVSGSAAQKKLIELRQTIIDSTGTTGKARDEVTKFVDSILKIPDSASVDVTADTNPAVTAISNLRNMITGIAGHHYAVYFDAKTNGSLPRGGNAASLSAYGNIFAYGTGGGDVANRHMPAIYRAEPNRVRIFAEPETQGEAYIPLANDGRRPRAQAILSETARRLGGAAFFADGGLVDLSGNGPYTLGGGTGTKAAAAGKKAAATSKAVAKAASTLATAQANIRFTASLDLSRLTSSGTASAIASAIRKLITDVHTAASKGIGSDSLIPTLQAENAQLGRLATERVGLTNKIKAATASLNQQRQGFAQESNTVAGAIGGVFDITSLDSPAAFGTASPDAFIRNLRLEAQQVDNADAQIEKLRSLGLDKHLIQQLGEKGAAAFPAIQSLSTASAAQVAQIDALYAKVQASSKATGNEVAASLFQAGIDSTVGFIRGLDSQLSKVNLAGSRLVATLVKQVKKDLGIKSPSVVMRQHGRFTAEGFALGIADRYGMVTSNANALANAAVRPTQFGSAPQFPNGLVHVHPAPNHSETAIGTAAGRYLATQFT
jgi:hypothetical protein